MGPVAAVANTASIPEQVLFWFLAAAIIGGAIFTMTRRNPVTAVMSLVGTFFALAALYATLSAHFLAIIQVLVYAGAIMVLFIFVVMILNREEATPVTMRGLFIRSVGVLSALYLVLVFFRIVGTSSVAGPPPSVPETFGTVSSIGDMLFRDFLYPFEAISLLLLVAIVGGVVVSRSHKQGGRRRAGGRGAQGGPADGARRLPGRRRRAGSRAAGRSGGEGITDMPTHYYLTLSFVLFLIGTGGVLLRRNALIVLMGIELQLNAGNLAMLAFSRGLGDQKGHVFAFLIIALAAAEAAVGLAILVGLFRSRQTINLDEASLMKR